MKLYSSDNHYTTAPADGKNLTKRTIPDKILKDTACEFARNCNYDGYQRALVSMVNKFFDKKTASGVIATSKAGMSVTEQLAKELHKPVIRKFKRRKAYARFKKNIWAANLAEVESLSSKNKNFKYLFYVIDVSLKIHGLIKIKKVKQFLKLLSKY